MSQLKYIANHSCLSLLAILALSSTLQADPPSRKAISRKANGGLQLDIGRFTPYARGIKIDIGPKTSGKRAVNVQVGPSSTIPVGVEVQVNGDRTPAYAEREGSNLGPEFASPQDEADLLGAPTEPNLLNAPSELGTPSEDGPTLVPPINENDSLQEAPAKTGVPLSAPAEPKAIAPPFPDSVKNPEQTGTKQQPSQAYLGVNVRPISAVMAAQFAELIPKGTGLRLVKIGHESAAEKAGLKRHDIILAFDQKQVSSLKALSEIVGQHQPGDEIEVVYLRASKVEQLTVVLGRRASPTGELQTVQTAPEKLDFRAADPQPISTDPARKLVVPLPNGMGFVEVGTYKPGPAPVIAPGTPQELLDQPVRDPRIIPQSGIETPNSAGSEYYSPRGTRTNSARSSRENGLLGTPVENAEEIEIPAG